jgi:PAS domain S-box-containing protein
VIGDLGGKIIDSNDAFLRLVGYSREDLLSGKMRWGSMTPPDYHELDRRAVEQLRSEGIAPPWEKEYFRKDGNRISVMIAVTTRVAAEGDVECVSFILDISERKQLELLLHRATLAAECQERVSSQHEPRNPHSVEWHHLELSKIEAGKIDLEAIDFSLRDSLESTLKTLALQADEKGLTLLCEVAPEAPEAVRGDSRRLRQVVTNLWATPSSSRTRAR